MGTTPKDKELFLFLNVWVAIVVITKAADAFCPDVLLLISDTIDNPDNVVTVLTSELFVLLVITKYVPVG